MLPVFQWISGDTSTMWRSGRALLPYEIRWVISKPRVNHENTKGLKHEKKVKFRVSTISCFRGFFARFHFLLNAFATLGAVFKILIQHFSATPACPDCIGLLLRGIRPKPLAGLRTALTYAKRLALFDSEYGNEKKAEIVVDALRISLVRSTHRTPAWILVQNLFFGRNTGNEDHGSKFIL